MIQNFQIGSKDSLIWCCGKNENSELSPSSQKMITSPIGVRLPNKAERIMQISISSNHTVLLSKYGDVYVMGSNYNNKLGLSGIENVIEPTQLIIPSDQKIVHIVAAENQTFLINEEYQVIVCRKSNVSNFMVQNFPLDVRIKVITCGDYHYVALSEEGQVFTWGDINKPLTKGQGGNGQTGIQPNPVQVEFFIDKKVKEIFSGGFHSFVICEDEKIYGWGEGIQGQLGNGQLTNFSVPTLISFNDDTIIITQIACGGHHTIFLDNEGRIYSCGRNSDGQLGLRIKKSQATPQLVEYFGDKYIIDVVCGWAHSVVQVEPSYIYIAGNGYYGQLGCGNNESQKGFVFLDQLQGKGVEKIFAGGHHTWFLLDYDDPELSDYKDPSDLWSQPKESHDQLPSLKDIENLTKTQQHQNQEQQILYKNNSLNFNKQKSDFNNQFFKKSIEDSFEKEDQQSDSDIEINNSLVKLGDSFDNVEQKVINEEEIEIDISSNNHLKKPNKDINEQDIKIEEYHGESAKNNHSEVHTYSDLLNYKEEQISDVDLNILDQKNIPLPQITLKSHIQNSQGQIITEEYNNPILRVMSNENKIIESPNFRTKQTSLQESQKKDQSQEKKAKSFLRTKQPQQQFSNLESNSKTTPNQQKKFTFGPQAIQTVTEFREQFLKSQQNKTNELEIIQSEIFEDVNEEFSKVNNEDPIDLLQKEDYQLQNNYQKEEEIGSKLKRQSEQQQLGLKNQMENKNFTSLESGGEKVSYQKFNTSQPISLNIYPDKKSNEELNLLTDVQKQYLEGNQVQQKIIIKEKQQKLIESESNSYSSDVQDVDLLNSNKKKRNESQENSQDSEDGFYIPFTIIISFTNLLYNHKMIFVKYDDLYEQMIVTKIKSLIRQIKRKDPDVIYSNIYSIETAKKEMFEMALFFEQKIENSEKGCIIYIVDNNLDYLNSKGIREHVSDYSDLVTEQTNIGKMYKMGKYDVFNDKKWEALAGTYLIFREQLGSNILGMNYYEMRSVNFKQYQFTLIQTNYQQLNYTHLDE